MKTIFQSTFLVISLFSIIVFGQRNSQQLAAYSPYCPSGIISYWNLDESSGSTYYDSISVNNASSPNIPSPVAGRVAGAQQFNGTSNRMTAPRIAAYDFTANSSFTIETWIKHPSATPSNNEQIFGRRATDNLLSIYLGFDISTNISFGVRSSSGESFKVTSSSSLYDDNWHHVVAVKDGALNQLRIYIDGVLENTVSASFSSGFASPTATLSIGWRDAGDPRYFEGTIDELAIYGVSLSTSFITMHYNNGLLNKGYCAPTAPTIVSNPVTTSSIGQIYLYNVDANAYPVATYSLTTSPAGMTINSTTGLIEWIPTSDGNYDVTVVASNGVDPDAIQSFTLNVSLTSNCLNNVVNYWKFDETSGTTFVDYAGNNNATSADAPTPVTGKSAGAQQFNGTSDRMTAPRIAAYDFSANSSFTFEAWIKHPTGTPTANEQILGRKASDNQTSIYLGFDISNNISFGVRSSSGQSFKVTGISNLYDNNWHHIVAVKDGSLNQLRIYVDGILENTATASYSSGFASPTATLSIGWRDAGDTRYFNGTVDELAIHDVALSEALISQHYNNGLQGGGYCYFAASPTITSLPATSATVGQLYTYDVNATGIPAPSYSLSVFPSGMTINGVTGVINWTPSASGDYDVTVVAANGINPDAAQSYVITVADAPICTDGLISYWKLNELSGNTYVDFISANNAATTDAPVSTTGRVETAQLFNGTSDRITAPRISAYDFASGSSFTFEAWVKHPAVTADREETIVGRKATDNQLSVQLGFISSTNVSFSVRSVTGESYRVNGTSNLYDNNWHHIVGVKDAATNQLRIYVDGVLENTLSANYSSGFGSSTATLNIGWRNVAGQENFYNGSIDEVAIYDRALSSNVITQHYANGLMNIGYCYTLEAPSITSSPVTTGMEGQTYYYNAEATGSPAPLFSLSVFPAGMSIHPVTGEISWVPSSSGNFDVTIIASNGVNPDASQSFSVNVAEAPPCPVGIISYWKLNGKTGNTYVDYVGGNNATSSDTPTPINGIVDGAQFFNGTSDRITAPRIASYDFAANSSFTFEAWIARPAGSPTVKEQIIGRKPTENQVVIFLGFDLSSSVEFSVRSKTGESFKVTGTSNLYDGNWHHVVGVRDANTNQLKIYVDGVLENTASAIFTSGFDSPTAPINIGFRGTSVGDERFFNGSIDEVAVYNSALNATNIVQHYNNGLQFLGYCNIAPEITSTPVLTGSADQLYSYVVKATGTPAPTFSLTSSPVGMTINTNTGLIEWTPTASGSYNVTVMASNGIDPAATQSFVINISAAPSCISGMLNYWKLNETTGNVFLDYMGLNNASSTDIPAPVTAVVAGGQRFDGISDRITAPRIADYDFAANSSFTFEAWIKHLPVAPAQEQIIGRKATDNSTTLFMGFDNSSNLAFNVRSSTGESFTVIGNSDLHNDTWHHVVGVKDGVNNQLKIYVDGVLENSTSASYGSGFNSASAAMTIGWRNISGDNRFFKGRMDEVAVYNIALDDATILQHYYNGLQKIGYCYTNLATMITSNPTKFATISQPYVYDVNSTGIPFPAYSLTTSPAGMTINPNSGLINWIPSALGVFDVVVQASNGFGPNYSQSFKIIVNSQPNTAPTITSTPITSANVGQPYTYDVNANGVPAPNFFLSIFPSGMSINSTTGVITWTPVSAGLFDVTVIASNGVNPDASQSFTISVQGIAPQITSTPNTIGLVGQLYQYDVEATGDPTPTFSLFTFPSGMTINSISGLIEWTPASAGNFDVTVLASNGILPNPSQSFTINVQQAPEAPSNLLASLSSTRINHVQLTWQDNSSNEVGFILERKTGDSLSSDPYIILDTLAADVISFVDSVVSDTTIYTYRVKAFSLFLQSNYSNAVSIETILSTLAAPTNLTAELSTTKVNRALLNWQDNSTNELGFYLERKLGDASSADPFSVIATIPADITAFEDSTLSDTTTYTFRLKAFNSFTESNYTNLAAISTVLSTLAAPSDLAADLSSTKLNHVNLAWQDNSTNELGFIVQRKMGDDSSTEPFSIIDTVAANISVFEDSLLSDTTTYTYRVKAYNSFLETDFTNSASITTLLSVIYPPSNLTASLSSTKFNHVELSWQEFSDNEMGFIIERKLGLPSSTNPFEVIDSVAADVITFEDSLLADSTTYTYRVKAFNSFLQSTYSNVVSITTLITSIVRGNGIEIPKNYALEQNYPNPFNPSTTIRFALPTSAHVEIILFNTIGQEVDLILSSDLNAGNHEMVFDASRLASGIYFYMIKAQGVNGTNFTSTKRMILMK
jgi:hypothetical protein